MVYFALNMMLAYDLVPVCAFCMNNDEFFIESDMHFVLKNKGESYWSTPQAFDLVADRYPGIDLSEYVAAAGGEGARL